MKISEISSNELDRRLACGALLLRLGPFVAKLRQTLLHLRAKLALFMLILTFVRLIALRIFTSKLVTNLGFVGG